jgi:predicted alpha/beta-hydrolase family hydrolase
VIYLAHGASGNTESMKPFMRGLMARGLDAQPVGLPVRKAEEVVDIYRSQVDDYETAIIGGHSYGGRVASLLAAQHGPRALVLLCYPLHRPGHPDDLRIAHWPKIDCPVLLLSGEADQFARIELLRKSVELLSDHRLITYPGVRHGLTPVLGDALDRIAEFVASLQESAPAQRPPKRA